MTKYRAVRVSASPLTDGYSFASKLERQVYLLLKAMEQHKELVIEKVQDRVILGPAKFDYRPDFRVRFTGADGPTWVEAKGFETASWRMKLKAWRVWGPGPLMIFKGAWQRPILKETVIPGESK